jgi:adhesin transport system outer membrane protein
MKTKAVLACGIVAGILCTPFAGTSNAATLGEELQVLLTQHPRVKAAQNEVIGADAAVRGAFSGYLPSVSLDGDTGYERIDSPTRRSSRQGVSEMWRDSLGVTVTQNLFDGFRREANLSGARINKSLSELSLDTTRQSLSYDGARVYIDVIRGARLVELAFNNENNVQRQLSLEDERVQRGAGISVDVLLAKSRLQLAKERRVGFEGQLREAVARYQQLFSRPPQPGVMEDPGLPDHLLPATKEAALQQALTNSPQIAFNGRQVEFQATRKEAAESDYWPRIDLVGRGLIENDVDAIKGERRELSALVKARWQLFNGFATQAAVAEASARAAASRDTLQAVTRQVAEEIEIAWNELQTARERVGLLENAVSIASEVFDARRRLRDAGRETAINVLDAENELYNARINLVSASFDARRAIYRVLLAIGQMTPDNLGVRLAAN